MSVQLRVDRSAIRQFLLGLAGLVLIVVAFDVFSWHILSGPPATNDDGVLTSRGIVHRRSDILWASLFIVSGLTMLGIAIVGLFRREPVVEVTTDALHLRIAGPRRGIAIPWTEIRSVRSGSERGDGAVPNRLLLVDVVDAAPYPPHPWGAEWDGTVLRVDAESWDTPPEEVAVHCNVALRRLRVARPARDDQAGGPSVSDGPAIR